MAQRGGPGSVPGTFRVLWLIKGLGPGGAERLLVSAAAAHDRSRFSFECAYVLPWKGHLAPDLAARDVAVHCLEGNDPRDPRWIVRLRRLLVEGRYDIVHAHLPLVAGVARLVVRSLPRKRRPRLVVTEHNAWPTYPWPTRFLNRLTAPLDDATIAVSDETRDSMRPASVRSRTRVVVHGVSLAQARAQRNHRQAVRAELGIGPDEVVVATVANFRAQKAYSDLLAAARSVLDRGLPARFVAVGQGPLEAEIRAEHERLALGDRFALLGFRDDAVRVLAGADVFTLASTYEGFPVALMEAMAVGLPVVATRVGGVAQAVRPGVEGLLVPPGRPELLADALADVVADHDLRARLARASALRGEEFDMARSVQRIEEVYLSVLGVKAGPAQGDPG
jgi:glycosyltransferase involved in cell wall biosynthesis